jgi:type IV pilus assembly protein PilN
MRIPINLASQPLEVLRPLRAAVIVAAVIAVALGTIILSRELRTRSEFRSLIQQQTNIEQEIRALQSQQEELEAALSTPEAQQIRERSGFMNSLILRKSLSWTQLFMDLERTLPSRARITAIHPQLGASEDVNLALTVSATSLEPLVEFLRNLESSPAFGAPNVDSQRHAADRAAGETIELSLTTRYVQDRAANLSRDRESSSTDGSHEVAADWESGASAAGWSEEETP